MDLEGHRRLTTEETSPPATQEPLVKCLVHAHEAICGGIVTAVGHDPQAHISAGSACMYSASKDRDQEHSYEEHSTDEGHLEWSGNK
jgi:hypothetical protein